MKVRLLKNGLNKYMVQYKEGFFDSWNDVFKSRSKYPDEPDDEKYYQFTIKENAIREMDDFIQEKKNEKLKQQIEVLDEVSL